MLTLTQEQNNIISKLLAKNKTVVLKLHQQKQEIMIKVMELKQIEEVF